MAEEKNLHAEEVAAAETPAEKAPKAEKKGEKKENFFVRFGKNYQARYFKLEPISEINSAQKTTIGEIGILVK